MEPDERGGAGIDLVEPYCHYGEDEPDDERAGVAHEYLVSAV